MIRNNQRRRRGGGGNGPRPQQMGGGNNYGNRLDNRQRGNATQLLEKYRALARDAQQAGDRVTAEYYLQYAEHYYRVLGDYRDRQPEQARRGRDGYDDEGADDQVDTIEDGAEDGEEAGEVRQEPEPRRDDRRERGRDRDFRRDRDGNRDGGRDANRDGSREAGREFNRSRDDRRERRERQPEPAAEAEEGPIQGLPGPATLRVVRREEPAASEAPASNDVEPAEEAPAPRRRGRPRKAAGADAPVEG